MTNEFYRLFADDELPSDAVTIKLFQEYNIPGVITPTSGFSSVKLYQDKDGNESKLLYTQNSDIQKYILNNFSLEKRASAS